MEIIRVPYNEETERDILHHRDFVEFQLADHDLQQAIHELKIDNVRGFLHGKAVIVNY